MSQNTEEFLKGTETTEREGLDNIAGIPEPEGKAEKLKHPEGGDDGRLGDVLGGHGNLVVTLLQVQPRENS